MHRFLALLRVAALPLLLLALLGPTQAAERRVALVIGNTAYRQAPLANPVNDANAMAQALREAGFDVKLLTDAGHRATGAAVREFGDRLRHAQVGVFYFAGHGMQIKGRNYLIPVDAEIEREDEVAYGALDAQAVLDKMEAAGNGTNLMILDACRNNPFARSFRSAQQGLAQMDAPVGTLVAFATSPGSVASDGAGRHGLYTDHLLKAMRQPGAKVEDVFKRVRTQVRKDSSGKQVPWEATSLEGDLVLFPAAPAAPAPATAPAPVPAPAAAVVTAPTTSLDSDRERRTAEILAELAATPAPAAAARRTPARNALGYTVGDRWQYQVIDRQRGEVVRNYGVRVARLLPDGGWADGGSTEYDAAGRPVRWTNADGVKRQSTPHAPRWWPGMVVGEQRRFEIESTGTPADGPGWTQKLDSQARVVAQETVKVPAGEFSALRVEHEGTLRSVGSYGYGTFRITLWYVPSLHTWVAYEYRSTWNGRPDADTREELTSYVLAGAR